MDVYHIWCNLKAEVRDVEFCAGVAAYLGELRAAGRIEGFRITRRKLGFGPRELGEFHIAIEVKDLAQLDAAPAGRVAAQRADRGAACGGEPGRVRRDVCAVPGLSG